MPTCPKCGCHFAKGEGQTDWLTRKEYCSDDCLDAVKRKHPKLRRAAAIFQLTIFFGFILVVWFLSKKK